MKRKSLLPFRGIVREILPAAGVALVYALALSARGLAEAGSDPGLEPALVAAHTAPATPSDTDRTMPLDTAGTSAANPASAAFPELFADETARLEVLGVSGNLRALIDTPAALSAKPALTSLLAGIPLDEPGVRSLPVRAPDGDALAVLALTSFGASGTQMAKGYRTGHWPVSDNPRYAPPAGFIEVTPENESTPVSKRFQLRDFLTHDQKDVWPKVLVLRPALLDKLELIGERLESKGLPGRLHVMSGFRTPRYNALGVGEKGGRASLSRHMYGDAADIFVDADGDERMDDLDGDGKITVRDARVLLAMAESVETDHPNLVGGLSAYPANSAHGPFVHVDVRGVRARW